METLYWINVIGNIWAFNLIAIAVSLFLFGFRLYIYLDVMNDYDRGEAAHQKKMVKKSIIPVVVCTLFLLFCPSKKDLYKIYGVGGTIDYIQKNKTAQGIPNEVIEALDRYLDKSDKKN